MDEGWLALYIAILRSVCPEQAFAILNRPEISSVLLHELILTPENLQDIQKLREKMSLVELAEAYGVNYNTMRGRIYNKNLKCRIG
jgi:hypothetical protein